MNIEDEIRRTIDTVVGPCNPRELRSRFQSLETEYEYQRHDPRWRRAADDAVAAADIGPAAYGLGVHYLVHDNVIQAEYWLRIAAEHDVGDAALRLAHLSELRAAIATNLCPDDSTDHNAHAEATQYWYARAASAGYTTETNNDGKMERPAIDFPNCCRGVTRRGAQEESAAMIAAAMEHADAAVRRSRADIKLIVDLAREEVDDLARQRAAIESDLKELQHLVYRLASSVASTRSHRRRRWLDRVRRHPVGRTTRPATTASRHAAQLCAQVLSELEGDPQMAGPLPLRAALTKVLESVERSQHGIPRSTTRKPLPTTNSSEHFPNDFGWAPT